MSSITNCDEMVRVSHIATAVPSILGGVFVATSFVLAPKIRTPSFGLILAMAMCDSLFSVAWLFPVPDDRTWLCRFQGWWIQFFPVTSVYLSLLTTVHIFLLITRSKAQHMKVSTMWRLALLSVLLSLGGSVGPFVTDHYGLLGKSCWIALDEDGRDQRVGKAFRFAFQYAAVWTICLVNIFLYYRMYNFTRTLSKQNQKAVAGSGSSPDASSAASDDSTLSSRLGSILSRFSSKRASTSSVGEDKVMQVVRRLRWYPVIMFCCWTGLILVRIYQFRSTEVPCWVLAVAQNMLNLQGFWNSLVFAANDTVWKAWYAVLGWQVQDPGSVNIRRAFVPSSSAGNASTSPSLLNDSERSDISSVQMRETSMTSNSTCRDTE